MKKIDIIEKILGIPPDYQYKALHSKNYIHSNWHKNKLDVLKLLLNLNKFSRILDLGMGSGNFEFAFHKQAKEIIGIDYNDEAIAFARNILKINKIKNVKLYVGNIKKLSEFNNLGKFEYIILEDVIEHFRGYQIKSILIKFKKFLKTNGKIIIITPNYKSPWIIIEYFFDLFKLTPEMGGKQHLSKFDNRLLKKIIFESGYKIENTVTFNTFSFLVPFQSLRKMICKWEIKHFRYGNLIAIIASY